MRTPLYLKKLRFKILRFSLPKLSFYILVTINVADLDKCIVLAAQILSVFFLTYKHIDFMCYVEYNTRGLVIDIMTCFYDQNSSAKFVEKISKKF